MSNIPDIPGGARVNTVALTAGTTQRCRTAGTAAMALHQYIRDRCGRLRRWTSARPAPQGRTTGLSRPAGGAERCSLAGLRPTSSTGATGACHRSPAATGHDQPFPLITPPVLMDWPTFAKQLTNIPALYAKLLKTFYWTCLYVFKKKCWVICEILRFKVFGLVASFEAK